MNFSYNGKNYSLSNWVNDSGHGYNWIRFTNENRLFIGLNCNGIGSTITTDKLYFGNVFRSELEYQVFGSGIFHDLIAYYNTIYNCPKYNYLQLEDAKDKIDKILVSWEKLKVFI